jgi:hypothetical protein
MLGPVRCFQSSIQRFQVFATYHCLEVKDVWINYAYRHDALILKDARGIHRRGVGDSIVIKVRQCVNKSSRVRLRSVTSCRKREP